MQLELDKKYVPRNRPDLEYVEIYMLDNQTAVGKLKRKPKDDFDSFCTQSAFFDLTGTPVKLDSGRVPSAEEASNLELISEL